MLESRLAEGTAEQVMEMQSDRNASLVHPACLGGRRREGKPEDMLYTHTHIETHTKNTESCKTSFADLLVNRALSHTPSCKVFCRITL